MKPKYLLFSAALLAMTQAVALTPVKKQISKVAARNKVAAAANAARANASAASVEVTKSSE